MTQRAVLFDVDGTLAETERDGHRVAFNTAFAAAGLPWRWDEALYGELLRVTGGRERIASYARRFEPGWLAQPDAQEQIAALHAQKNVHYARLVADGVVGLRPGVTQLFDALAAAGWQLALVTTTSRANLEVLLQTALGGNALQRFAAIVVGEDVVRKKPSPDAYELALQRLRLPAEAVIAVEDSANGLHAALAASIPTVIVRGRYMREQDFTGALAVFDVYAAPDMGGLDADFFLRSERRLRIAVD